MKTETVIAELEAHIVSECNAVDVESQYCDMLDECYSFDSVGGIFACMSPSRVLRECDPIAYRCGMNDWLDGEGYIEIGSDYYRADDVESAKAEFVSELESEIADLESEIEELEESGDEHDPDPENEPELTNLRAKLETLRASLSTVEKHSF